MYEKLCEIPPDWKERLLEFFCLGLPACTIKCQASIDKDTIDRLFLAFRVAIYRYEIQALSAVSEQIALDKTMFKTKIPEKVKNEYAYKYIVFGIYQGNGKTLTFPVTGAAKRKLMTIIPRPIGLGLFFKDDRYAYILLEDNSDPMIFDEKNCRVMDRDYLNGIKGFYSYIRHWFYWYNSIPREFFYLYLKEVEWRFNHWDENLTRLLKKILDQ